MKDYPDIIDCGKRIADEINIHLLCQPWDDVKHKWMAFSLAEGRSDGTLYDSHKDAADHQRNERQALYVSFLGLGPSGAKPLECSKLLNFWRDAYEAGARFIDKGERYRLPLYTAAQNDYRNTILRNDWIDQAIREFIKTGNVT